VVLFGWRRQGERHWLRIIRSEMPVSTSLSQFSLNEPACNVHKYSSCDCMLSIIQNRQQHDFSTFPPGTVTMSNSMSINQTVQSVPLKGMRQACHECVCSVDKKNPRCTGMHYITVSRKLATLCVAGYLMCSCLNLCDIRNDSGSSNTGPLSVTGLLYQLF